MKKKRTKNEINDGHWFNETIHLVAKQLLKGTRYFDEFGEPPLQVVDTQFYHNLRLLLKMVALEGVFPPQVLLENKQREFAMQMATEMDRHIASAITKGNFPTREIKRNKAGTYNLQTRLVFCDLKVFGVADVLPDELIRS